MSISYGTHLLLGRSQRARIPPGLQSRWGTRTRQCCSSITGSGCLSSTRTRVLGCSRRQSLRHVEGNEPHNSLTNQCVKRFPPPAPKPSRFFPPFLINELRLVSQGILRPVRLYSAVFGLVKAR